MPAIRLRSRARELQRSQRQLARWSLLAFLVTFVLARCLVLLIMTRRLPDLFIYVGGTHLHHLNFGIFLLASVGAWLLLAPPMSRGRRRAAILYGVGLALTFDEFGMWLHLGGGYWQRASFDAVCVVAAILAAFSIEPPWRQVRATGLWTSVALGVLLIAFAALMIEAIGRVEPALQRIEQAGPP